VHLRVRYGGLPADRLWEMEDAQIEFSSGHVDTLDTGRLLLAVSVPARAG
jgi:hypothetical protein